MNLGSALGGLAGTFLLPGLGTAGGAAVGGAIDWGIGSLFGQGGLFNPGPGADEQFKRDQEEFNKILASIMGGADYSGLERQAAQTVQGNTRLFDAAFAGSGLSGSGLAADAKGTAVNQVLAQLSQQINADKLGRAQMAMGLYGQLGQNKAAGAAAAQQNDMAFLSILGQLAGTQFGGNLLNSLLPQAGAGGMQPGFPGATKTPGYAPLG